MQQEKNDDAQKVHVVDTRRFEAEDDAGHLIGSHQAGSSDANMKKEREAEKNDRSELNKLDDREEVGGNEAG